MGTPSKVPTLYCVRHKDAYKRKTKTNTKIKDSKTFNKNFEHFQRTLLSHDRVDPQRNFLIHEQRLLTKIDKLNSQKLEKKKARPILLAQVLGVVH